MVITPSVTLSVMLGKFQLHQSIPLVILETRLRLRPRFLLIRRGSTWTSDFRDGRRVTDLPSDVSGESNEPRDVSDSNTFERIS